MALGGGVHANRNRPGGDTHRRQGRIGGRVFLRKNHSGRAGVRAAAVERLAQRRRGRRRPLRMSGRNKERQRGSQQRRA